MSSNFATNKKTSRGFSLMEMGVVLGIVGAVLAALWSAARTVEESSKQNLAIRQHVIVVKNIRDFFSTRSVVATPAGTSTLPVLTDYLVRETVVLREQIKKSTGATIPAYHPWPNAADSEPSGTTGTFGVCSGGGACKATDTSSEFSLVYYGLKQASCAGLASKLSSSSGPPGLKAIYINGGAALTPPLAADAALESGKCDKTTATNKLEFVYRLRHSY